jgi:hypothetical protein
MIVNQMMSEATVEATGNRAATQQAIASSAIEARASLRRMQLGVGDVRLAKSGQDIEKASAAVAEGFAAGTKGMDSAISKVTRPENGERFEKAKSLVNAYEAVSGEIRRSQLRIFEITAKRIASKSKRPCTRPIPISMRCAPRPGASLRPRKRAWNCCRPPAKSARSLRARPRRPRQPNFQMPTA